MKSERNEDVSYEYISIGEPPNQPRKNIYLPIKGKIGTAKVVSINNQVSNAKFKLTSRQNLTHLHLASRTFDLFAYNRNNLFSEYIHF